MVVFGIILLGFAYAHMMVFGSRLEEFRDIWQASFSLVRSLIGDFDFSAMQSADQIMGPALFILFVSLSVFVILNMIIATISDGYAEAVTMANKKMSINLLQEMLRFTVVSVVKGIEMAPGLGPPIQRCRLRQQEEAKRLTTNCTRGLLHWVNPHLADEHRKQQRIRILEEQEAANAAAKARSATPDARQSRSARFIDSFLDEITNEPENNGQQGASDAAPRAKAAE